MYVVIVVVPFVTLIPGLDSDQAAVHLRDLVSREGQQACPHHSLGYPRRPFESNRRCSRQCCSREVPQGQVRLHSHYEWRVLIR